MTGEGVAATPITTGCERLREQTQGREGPVAPPSPFSGHDVRTVHMALDEDSGLREHTPPSPILVQVVEGRVRFDVEGQGHEPEPGGTVHVAASVPHAFTSVGTALTLVILLDLRSHVHS